MTHMGNIERGRCFMCRVINSLGAGENQNQDSRGASYKNKRIKIRTEFARAVRTLIKSNRHEKSCFTVVKSMNRI